MICTPEYLNYPASSLIKSVAYLLLLFVSLSNSSKSQGVNFAVIIVECSSIPVVCRKFTWSSLSIVIVVVSFWSDMLWDIIVIVKTSANIYNNYLIYYVQVSLGGLRVLWFNSRTQPVVRDRLHINWLKMQDTHPRPRTNNSRKQITLTEDGLMEYNTSWSLRPYTEKPLKQNFNSGSRRNDSEFFGRKQVPTKRTYTGRQLYTHGSSVHHEVHAKALWFSSL